MKQNNILERLKNGILSENPTFVLMLGMCSTLAVTTSAVNGLGMGLTTMVVLAMSNMFISLLRKVIPDKVRIPAFIVVIASFVTVVELLLKAYIPFLYDALGLYIPLIVVNCIILGRAEAYASKNNVINSLFDGIGMGLGFTLALTIIGAVREILGAGEVFGYAVMPESYVPCSIFVLAPGAFFVLAALTAIQNKIKITGEKKGKDMSKIGSGCSEDCMNCGDLGCARRFYDTVGLKIDTAKTEVSEELTPIVTEKEEPKTETLEKAEEKTEEKPKPKRGRPPKAKTEAEKAEVKAAEPANGEEKATEETEEKPKPRRGRPPKAKTEAEKAEVKAAEPANVEEKATEETEEKPKPRRGRPPKAKTDAEKAEVKAAGSANVEEKATEETEEKPKPKRGRPPKAKAETPKEEVMQTETEKEEAKND